MNTQKPIFTILALLVAGLFVLVSRPLLARSLDQQMEAMDFRPESAEEDTGRMAGLAFLAGQIIYGGIGAAIGVVFATVGFLRKERWKAFRWIILAVNFVAAALIAFAIFSDLASGAMRSA